MDGKGRARVRRKVPWALLGMAVLVASIELGLARWGNAFSDPVGLQWRFGALAAQRNAPGNDVLFVGDSLMKCGVVAEVFEAQLGHKSFSLALIGAPAPVTFFQLRRALEAGARPRAIVFDFAPYLLDWAPRRFSQLLPEALTLRDCADLAWQARDTNLFAELVVARILPSVRDRVGIRGWVMATVGARTATGNGMSRSFAAGGAVAPGLFFPSRWRCAPVNALYIERTLALGERRGIAVFWLMPPFRADAHDRRARMGLDGQYTAYVQEIQARHPWLRVIEGRTSEDADGYFSDAFHLNRRGALIFSAAVAEVLGRCLHQAGAKAQWIVLPPSRNLAVVGAGSARRSGDGAPSYMSDGVARRNPGTGDASPSNVSGGVARRNPGSGDGAPSYMSGGVAR